MCVLYNVCIYICIHVYTLMLQMIIILLVFLSHLSGSFFLTTSIRTFLSLLAYCPFSFIFQCFFLPLLLSLKLFLTSLLLSLVFLILSVGWQLVSCPLLNIHFSCEVLDSLWISFSTGPLYVCLRALSILLIVWKTLESIFPTLTSSLILVLYMSKFLVAISSQKTHRKLI